MSWNVIPPPRALTMQDVASWPGVIEAVYEHTMYEGAELRLRVTADCDMEALRAAMPIGVLVTFEVDMMHRRPLPTPVGAQAPDVRAAKDPRGGGRQRRGRR